MNFRPAATRNDPAALGIGPVFVGRTSSATWLWHKGFANSGGLRTEFHDTESMEYQHRAADQKDPRSKTYAHAGDQIGRIAALAKYAAAHEESQPA